MDIADAFRILQLFPKRFILQQVQHHQSIGIARKKMERRAFSMKHTLKVMSIGGFLDRGDNGGRPGMSRLQNNPAVPNLLMGHKLDVTSNIYTPQIGRIS